MQYNVPLHNQLVRSHTVFTVEGSALCRNVIKCLAGMHTVMGCSCVSCSEAISEGMDKKIEGLLHNKLMEGIATYVVQHILNAL